MIFHHSHALGASLCMVLAIASPARADELAEISKAGVLTVGIFEDFPLFDSTGTDLKPQD